MQLLMGLSPSTLSVLVFVACSKTKYFRGEQTLAVFPVAAGIEDKNSLQEAK